MTILGRQGIGNYLQMLLLVANEAKGPLLLVQRLELVNLSASSRIVVFYSFTKKERKAMQKTVGASQHICFQHRST